MPERGLTPEGCWKWRETFDGTAAAEYTGAEKEVRVPETLGGMPVTEIGGHAFAEAGQSVEIIRVPGTVRRILPHAFELCMQLREVILSEGIIEIGEDFLAGTGVTELTVPASVRRIRGVSALPCRVVFAEGNARYTTDGFGIYRKQTLEGVQPCRDADSFTVREGTVEILPGVFEGREALRCVRLPASLRILPEGVLANIRNMYSASPGITKAEADPGNPVFFEADGGLYERLSGNGGIRLHRWFGSGNEPALLPGTTEIGRYAFLRTPVRTFTVGRELLRIGENAFSGTALKEAVFPDGERIRFPDGNPYLLKDLLRGFGRNGELYDFAEYDRKLERWYPDLSRVEMLLSRLVWRKELTETSEKRYMEMLEMHLHDIIRMIGTADRPELLTMLFRCGFPEKDEDAGKAVAYLGEMGRPELAASMMIYRKTHFARKKYDYSL